MIKVYLIMKDGEALWSFLNKDKAQHFAMQEQGLEVKAFEAKEIL